MIDNYLLEQLVTFAKVGTLSQTAQILNRTQPTITRGMQKLESELNVQLFERRPNHLTLTLTGQYAAQKAEKLLHQQKQALKDIRNYNRSHTLIKIASVAPGPLLILQQLLSQLSDQIEINNQLLAPAHLIQKLEDQRFTLIITNHPITNSHVESSYLGQEQLAINLDKANPTSSARAITFADLAGQSFIVLNNIGIWKKIIQKEIPTAKFFYQNQNEAFTAIIQSSKLPYFSTNFTQFRCPANRICLPISDKEAQMDFYAIYLTQNASKLTSIIDKLKFACSSPEKTTIRN